MSNKRSKKRHSDKYYMQIALKAAALGKYTTSPNPSVGCVIVRDHKILSVGYHHKAGEPHAEVMALRAANFDVAGATVYVTLEPCSHYGRTPPCALALRDAKVKRVVIACKDPNPKVAGRGIAILEAAGIEVVVGVLEKKASKLNRAFFKSIQTRRPFTLLKYGMSLDAKIALSNKESQWITNEQSRSDVQRLRLWSDALISSRDTVLADNPRLNVRVNELPFKLRVELKDEELKQPIQVIIDSEAYFCKEHNVDLLARYQIFRNPHVYIVCTKEAMDEDFVLAPVSPVAALATRSQDKNASELIISKHTFSIDSESNKASLSAVPKLTELTADCWCNEFALNKQSEELSSFEVEPWLDNVTIVKVPRILGKDGKYHVSLDALMNFLGSLEIRVAMVEAGPRLGSAFLEAGFVDECYCYIAPKILGSEAMPAFTLSEPQHLKDVFAFSKCDCRRFGSDTRLRFSC